MGWNKDADDIIDKSQPVEALDLSSLSMDADATTIIEFEGNLNNRDRLFEITDSLLNAGNVLLSDNEKYGISALVLSGLWVETSYIGLMHSDNIDKEELNDKLRLHYNILGEINKLLDCLSDESIISELKVDLKELEKKGPENQSLLNDIILIRDKFSQ
jgi:hypothetical protein